MNMVLWMWLRTRDACVRAVVASAAALAACGGGDTPATADAGADASQPTPDDLRETAQAYFPPNVTIPADAHLKGMWAPLVYAWPLIPIHAVLLPDGRMLTYGTTAAGQQTGYFVYDVWDGAGAPDRGHSTLPNLTRTDLFCSAQLLLANGDVFIAGGDNWTGTKTTNTGNNNTNIFHATTNTLERGPNMAKPRWYATATTLPNGELYLQGGSGGGAFPEVRATNGTLRSLTAAVTSGLNTSYPRNFVAPDGRIFGYDVMSRMYYVDTRGTGKLTSAGTLDTWVQAGSAGADDSSVMFGPGRILHIGGNYRAAYVIDLNSGSPVVTPAGSLTSRRRWVNTTVLPDGKVVATGGSGVYNALTDVNNKAEIYDPRSNGWTVGPAGQLARLYHSMSLLLPNGSVMVGGGGANGPLTNTNVELYYPPYFFKAGAQLAARPTITLAPTSVNPGTPFSVDISSANGISRVALIKTASVTHSFNMEQRRIELTFTRAGNRLTVQPPSSNNVVPPGFYHLFVLDNSGVPSVSHIVKVGVKA